MAWQGYKIFFLFAMDGSTSHAIVYGIHYVVCIGIPHSHMAMSHDHMVCLFDDVVFEKKHTTWLGLLSSTTKHSSH